MSNHLHDFILFLSVKNCNRNAKIIIPIIHESCCSHHTRQNKCIRINLPYRAAFKGTQKHNGGHQYLSLFISCVLESQWQSMEYLKMARLCPLRLRLTILLNKRHTALFLTPFLKFWAKLV